LLDDDKRFVAKLPGNADCVKFFANIESLSINTAQIAKLSALNVA
jgi:hypothetical protein